MASISIDVAPVSFVHDFEQVLTHSEASLSKVFFLNHSFPGSDKVILTLVLFLTNFMPMFRFFTLWKYQKTSGFLTFLGVVQMKHENGQN